jgi:hypothetical protein
MAIFPIDNLSRGRAAKIFCPGTGGMLCNLSADTSTEGTVRAKKKVNLPLYFLLLRKADG